MLVSNEEKLLWVVFWKTCIVRRTSCAWWTLGWDVITKQFIHICLAQDWKRLLCTPFKRRTLMAKWFWLPLPKSLKRCSCFRFFLASCIKIQAFAVCVFIRSRVCGDVTHVQMSLLHSIVVTIQARRTILDLSNEKAFSFFQIVIQNLGAAIHKNRSQSIFRIEKMSNPFVIIARRFEIRNRLR